MGERERERGMDEGGYARGREARVVLKVEKEW
jgi:hypothetical protein